jgi:arabinose-5-phosphate isomerase
MLAVGDALALSVMECKAIQPDQYAGYHPGGALGRFLMKTREVMRTGPDCPTCRESDSLAACYKVILAAPRRAGAAVIADEQGRLTGIITHGDFFRMFLSSEREATRPVRDVMTRNPKRIGLDTRVTDALRLMRTHAIDELPVVDEDDRAAGLIDIQDLLARGFSGLDAP